MPPKELNKLRLFIIGNINLPKYFYPITLTQISTVGEIHNLTPQSMVKKVPSVGAYVGHSVPIFRFYFDGLVAHVHRTTTNDRAKIDAETADFFVGSAKDLIVPTVTYAGSFERENFDTILAEARQQWPEAALKLLP